MSRFNPRLVAVILFAVAGYAAFHFTNFNRTDWREFAASDSKITAFALLGRDDDYGKSKEWYAAQPKFHSEIILSQMPVKDTKMRLELRQTFVRITPSDIASACIPDYRHALRFEKDGRTVDALICFGCGQMEISDSVGKKSHVDFQLSPSQGRDKFDTIFARLGMKQWKPYEKK